MVVHKSDCAVHNAPALPVGPCDCGAGEPSREAFDEARRVLSESGVPMEPYPINVVNAVAHALDAFSRSRPSRPVEAGEAVLLDLFDRYADAVRFGNADYDERGHCGYAPNGKWGVEQFAYFGLPDKCVTDYEFTKAVAAKRAALGEE